MPRSTLEVVDEAVEIEPDPGFYTKTSCLQLMYGIWVNLTVVAVGLAHGFPAIQLAQLNSARSGIAVTMEEGSWIASVLLLCSPIGCMIGGYLTDHFGRRLPLLICQIPMFIGWLCVGTAQSARDIIVGRAVTGVGCGMALGLPRVYTSEISLPNMRGFLGAIPNIFMCLGFTVQAAFGSFLHWKSLCYLSCAYNAILLFSYIFLKESPHYLLLHGHEEKARKNLAYFRAKSYPVDKEMNRLIEFKQTHSIRRYTLKEQIPALFSSPTCKPFGIAMTYIAFGCFSGVQISTTWTITLLMLANSSFDVYVGNFWISITRLFAGTIGCVLLYHMGRRPIALLSAFGMGISSLTLGFILLYHKEPTIAPQIHFMLFMGLAVVGFQCMPFLLMSEMYPLQVRGLLTGISFTLTCVMIFFATKCFPYLHEAVGISNTLFIFGTSALLATIYLFFLMPETKGLTLHEIEEYFRGSRPNLISDRDHSQLQLRSKTSLTIPESKEAKT